MDQTSLREAITEARDRGDQRELKRLQAQFRAGRFPVVRVTNERPRLIESRARPRALADRDTGSRAPALPATCYLTWAAQEDIEHLRIAFAENPLQEQGGVLLGH